MISRADARRLLGRGFPLGLALLAAIAASSRSSAETFSATSLSGDSGAKTDRRPVPVGFYSASANKTFVSWMGSGTANTAIVKEYNHATGTWTADKVIGNSSTLDSHNYASMIQGGDHRLYVFHGCHNSPMKMAKSPNPLSISGTWTDTTLSTAAGASYPAPVVTSNGTIYVGYRWTRMNNGHSDDRPYAFIKSTNNGASWTRLVVIDPYPRSDNLTEIYNGKVSYEPAHGSQKAKIHVAWTIAGGGPGTHAHATYGRNVYYAYLDPTNDRMFSAAGADLGTTISNSEAETHCKVLDTGCSSCGHEAALQVSAHYLDSGRPIVFYSHLGTGLSSSAWNGSSWIKRTVTSSEGEPREVFKFGPQSFKAFRASGNACEYYRSTDGGMSWAFEGSVTAPHPVSRCYVINSHHPDIKLFLEDKVAGADTSTARVTGGFEPWYEVGGDGTPTPTPSPTPGARSTPTPTPGAPGGFSGYYKILARHSGKAVVVQNASTTNGANVYQWTYSSGGSNDEWELRSLGDGYYRMINRQSGKDLNVSGASTANGADVDQWSWADASQQRWQITDLANGYYRIAVRHSGKVLNIAGASTSDGANVDQWSWANVSQQMFQLVSIP